MPPQQEHSNIKIWAESYDLLINLQKALPAHPDFVAMTHQALCQYAKMLNEVHGYKIPIPPNPKERRRKKHELEPREPQA